MAIECKIMAIVSIYLLMYLSIYDDIRVYDGSHKQDCGNHNIYKIVAIVCKIMAIACKMMTIVSKMMAVVVKMMAVIIKMMAT